MNQLGALVPPVTASSGFQPDLCCLRKMLSASRGPMPHRPGAVIVGVAGKDTSPSAWASNHIDPEGIALLLLSFPSFPFFVFPPIIILKACGVILFLLISWPASGGALQQLLWEPVCRGWPTNKGKKKIGSRSVVTRRWTSLMLSRWYFHIWNSSNIVHLIAKGISWLKSSMQHVRFVPCLPNLLLHACSPRTDVIFNLSC